MGGIGNMFEDLTGINTGSDSRADQARRAQGEAAANANNAQLQMYNQTRDDLGTYRDAGSGAINSLQSNDFMKNWQADPGYQFRMSEGMKALQGSAAARGNLNSGATLKALTKYGQDTASQEYGNIYNREYNRLSNLANIGQNSAAQTGQAAQNYANAYGQNVTGAANASAAANIAQGQQMSQFAGGAIKGGMAFFCDERLKTNVKPVSMDDLNELRAAIKPYHFEYVSNNYGEGEWVGVMAQDLEKTKLGKTVVFETIDGHKKVHMLKLLSLLVASFGEAA